MSGLSLNTNINVNSTNALKADSIKVQPKTTSPETIKTEQPKSDNVQIAVKKGVVPTLEGAGLGAILGAGSTIAIAQIAEKGKAFAGEGGLAMIPVVAAGLAVGTVIGGATANITHNKTKAAIGGAISGALTGAAIVAATVRKPEGIAIAAGLGAVVGAASAFGGALVSKTK